MAADPSPNVVVLCADQLRPFELGCHGHPLVKTPHIDRLAAMGVRFETACTPNPVCTPARSALISGQYSRTSIGMLGCCGNPSERRAKFPGTTLPELCAIGAPSYETFLCGKWHVEPNPLRVGFERAVYPKVHHRNAGQTYFDGTGKSWKVDGYCPDFEVETSREFMCATRERPFFLFHNFSLPHMPWFDLPGRYRERYSRNQAILRPNVFRNEQMYYNRGAFQVYWADSLHYNATSESEKVPYPEDCDLRQLTAWYYGAIEAVDDQLGALLDALETSGKMENTIIAFVSDHGENLGSHWLWNKISLNDEALRIPFIVAWPGKLPPRVVQSHVASLVDVAPTVLSLINRPVPAHMSGRDLTPILKGQTGRIGDGAALVENLHGEVGIRTPDHLYAVMTRTRDDGPQRQITDDESLFFDLRTDPYEIRNLARTNEQRDVAKMLRERVVAWDASTPWMPTSRGGVYAQGPQQDPKPPRSSGVFG